MSIPPEISHSRNVQIEYWSLHSPDNRVQYSHLCRIFSFVCLVLNWLCHTMTLTSSIPSSTSKVIRRITPEENNSFLRIYIGIHPIGPCCYSFPIRLFNIQLTIDIATLLIVTLAARFLWKSSHESTSALC